MTRAKTAFLCMLILAALFMTPAALGDTLTQNGIEITLTSEKEAYQAGENIPVMLTVTNRSGLPASQVSLEHIVLSGYSFTADSEPSKQQALLNHGESLSITAVNAISPILPKTGDSSHPGLWLTLLLCSILCMVCISIQNKGVRRFLCMALCFACISAYFPGAAGAFAEENAFSLNYADWPDKSIAKSRSASQMQTVTAEVTESITIGGKQMQLKANVSCQLPNGSDNLQDETIDLGDLETMESQGIIDVTYGHDGSIVMIDGPFTSTAVHNVQDAASVLNAASSLFGEDFHASANDIAVQQMTDINDVTERYFRYTPSVNGIPVLGCEIVLSAKEDGIVRSLTNSYDNHLYSINTTPTLTAQESITSVKNILSSNEQLRPYIEELIYNAKLLVYAADESKPISLVYAVNVTNKTASENSVAINSAEGIIPPTDYTYYIYANTQEKGTIHSEQTNQISWSSTYTYCTDLLNQRRRVNCEEENGKYRLRDTVNHIATYKAGHDGQNPIHLAEYAESFDFFGSQRMDKEFVSAHANMTDTYRYYLTKLNRKSFDDNGAWIRISTKYDNDNWFWPYSGSFWSSSKQLFAFGEGENYVAALDVVAHEFTHGVISYVVGSGYNDNGLTYQGESGALNEAYADIMGSLVENKSGDDRWLIGEDTGTATRNLADPSEYGDPEHYSNWRYRTQLDQAHDWGGVHSNCAIFTYAVYKMMTDTRTAAISDDTWAQVFYDSLHRYVADSTFLHGRCAVICSAKKYGFTSDQQQAIKDAFDAVGISEAETIRFVLRWGRTPRDLDSHLVGPGAKNASDRFHIYYGRPTYYNNGSYTGVFSSSDTIEDRLYAADLDYDDVTSYGPEITTIHTFTPGTYYFFVHDFTNGGTTGSAEMANSAAYVDVYLPNGFKHYAIEPTCRGTYWDVCKITIDSNKNVSIEGINTCGDTTTCR